MIIFTKLLLYFLYLTNSYTNSDLSYDLPVISSKVIEQVSKITNIRNESTGKFIPYNVWIAVRNISDPLANHMTGPNGFIVRNHDWVVHLCDNDEKDRFMREQFANTSILWAYEILNPLIGTAKAELWRLCVLYLHGGMYMDDDADIAVRLRDVVRPTDKFIAGKEVYDADDRCYKENFPLSNHSFQFRFGALNAAVVFDGKFFFNWAMFSMPGHPLLRRIMGYVVDLIKHEYLGQSLIKMSASDHRGKLLMCASTFPITLAAREMVLEAVFQQQQLLLLQQKTDPSTIQSKIRSINETAEHIGIRIGGEMFREYGANMKAWFNDHSPTHWVKMIHKKRTPYLREYAPPRAENFEGKLIQGTAQRDVYLVQRGKRRAFPDFTTFLAMNYSTESVETVGHNVLSILPIGDLLPKVV